jgi:hypothetical protein
MTTNGATDVRSEHQTVQSTRRQKTVVNCWTQGRETAKACENVLFAQQLHERTDARQSWVAGLYAQAGTCL